MVGPTGGRKRKAHEQRAEGSLPALKAYGRAGDQKTASRRQRAGDGSQPARSARATVTILNAEGECGKW